MFLQHEDDYMAAKRNLERKRQELIQQKQMEKMKRKSESSSAPATAEHQSEKQRVAEHTPTQLHRYKTCMSYCTKNKTLKMLTLFFVPLFLCLCQNVKYPPFLDSFYFFTVTVSIENVH